MSQANAAAIRRRANQPQTSASNDSQPIIPAATSPRPTAGLTLQQVINTFDKRINQIESDVRDIQTSPAASSQSVSNNIDLPTIFDEFNARFIMIADEIASIKDVILKLQSFTMEVNKSLYDERIHILSDLGNSSIAGSTLDNRSNHMSIQNDDEKSPTNVDGANLAVSEH
jgi:hypothetical protein